jgi:glycosyltransferase involved in cell wall biosynthesis
MNIAIFSPNQNPYSETFIQAHKNNLKGKIFYYYGAGNQIKLENDTLKNTLLDRSQFKLFKRLSYFWKVILLKSLRDNKIDSILIEYGNHAHNLLPLLKKLEIPFVVHFHGYDASVNSVVETCNNYKDVFNLANKVIVVSNVMKQKIENMGCTKNKIVLATYGPNDLFFNIKPTFSKKQFISIGRFVEKKAPNLLILAFSKVVAKYPSYVLKMAGDGVLLNDCKNLVTNLGIGNNVQFLGVVTPELYRNELQNSLAFVQHSITADNGDMEGTPLAVLEASAAGVPVVSTYHAGIPDVIIHEQTGLLCEEKDVQKMAENLIELIENKELATRLGANGKARIKNEFNMSLHISKIQKTLN